MFQIFLWKNTFRCFSKKYSSFFFLSSHTEKCLFSRRIIFLTQRRRERRVHTEIVLMSHRNIVFFVTQKSQKSQKGHAAWLSSRRDAESAEVFSVFPFIFPFLPLWKNISANHFENQIWLPSSSSSLDIVYTSITLFSLVRRFCDLALPSSIATQPFKHTWWHSLLCRFCDFCVK